MALSEGSARCASHNLSLNSRFQMSNDPENARPVENPPTGGIEQAGVIDFFAHIVKADEVLLDDSELQLFQVQEKFNAYVSFLLDGELAEAHPELADKNARIELRCADMPKGRALDLLNSIHDQLAFQDIRVEVIVEDRSGSCGEGCTCH